MDRKKVVEEAKRRIEGERFEEAVLKVKAFLLESEHNEKTAKNRKEWDRKRTISREEELADWLEGKDVTVIDFHTDKPVYDLS